MSVASPHTAGGQRVASGHRYRLSFTPPRRYASEGPGRAALIGHEGASRRGSQLPNPRAATGNEGGGQRAPPIRKFSAGSNPMSQVAAQAERERAAEQRDRRSQTTSRQKSRLHDLSRSGDDVRGSGPGGTPTGKSGGVGGRLPPQHHGGSTPRWGHRIGIGCTTTGAIIVIATVVAIVVATSHSLPSSSTPSPLSSPSSSPPSSSSPSLRSSSPVTRHHRRHRHRPRRHHHCGHRHPSPVTIAVTTFSVTRTIAVTIAVTTVAATTAVPTTTVTTFSSFLRPTGGATDSPKGAQAPPFEFEV